MGIPWVCYGLPTGVLRGVLNALLWDSYGMPMGFLWGFPQESYGLLMGVLWESA